MLQVKFTDRAICLDDTPATIYDFYGMPLPPLNTIVFVDRLDLAEYLVPFQDYLDVLLGPVATVRDISCRVFYKGETYRTQATLFRRND